MISTAPVRLVHRDLFSLIPPSWRRRELRLRWLGIALLGSLFALGASMRGNLPLWQQELTSLLVTASYWQGNATLFFLLRRRLPGYEVTAYRVLLHVLLAGGYVAAVSLLNAGGIYYLNGGLAAYWTLYRDLCLTGLLVTTGGASLYGLGYFFYQWRQSATRAIALERDAALHQLAALRQQIAPHFLFNSLNTMAALIGDNPPAQDFLGELARVYRYVLLSQEHATVPLSQELAFAEAFLYLTHIRFGAGIEVTQHIAPAALGRHLPPLAVQLLLENALKHNAFDPDCPLRITIEAEAGELRVTNNVQPKKHLAAGTRQGLRNISSRYRLFTRRPVVIEDRGHEFAVILPLLEPAP